MPAKKKKNGLEIMGYFVWWSMEGINFSREEFEKLIEQSPLDISPPKLCHRTAFLEAVRWVKAKSHTHHLLIRTVSKDKEAHYFALVDEKIDIENKQAGYTHEATLRFDQETFAVTCNQLHRAHETVKQRFQENVDNLNSYELRRWVQKILDRCRNISVRDKGGLYYVDLKYTDVLLGLEQIFDSVPGADFFIVEQIDSERSKKSIWKAFVEDLNSKITKFREALQEGKYSSNKGWENAIAQFKELKEEVGFYADRLSFTGSDLNKNIEELTGEFRRQLVD